VYQILPVWWRATIFVGIEHVDLAVLLDDHPASGIIFLPDLETLMEKAFLPNDYSEMNVIGRT
jgi:hypothetical protein